MVSRDNICAQYVRCRATTHTYAYGRGHTCMVLRPGKAERGFVRIMEIRTKTRCSNTNDRTHPSV